MNPTTTTWKMMKSGQWMELRQDVRPPSARRRRHATGTRAVWWPENTSWNMVQWVPREEATEATGQQAMAQKPVLRTGLNRERQATETFYPEEQRPQDRRRGRG